MMMKQTKKNYSVPETSCVLMNVGSDLMQLARFSGGGVHTPDFPSMGHAPERVNLPEKIRLF